MTRGAGPSQLLEYELIRVERNGKVPVVSPEHVEPLSAIRRWVADGGNYGVRATAGDDLVILDVDHRTLRTEADAALPATFTVETGSGQHRYFRCPVWSENQQLTADGTDLGSLRATNWYAVGPGSVHPDGARYRVVEDRRIAEVPASDLRTFSGRWYDETDGGERSPASARPRVGSSETEAVPAGYPSRSAGWETLRSWLEANGLYGRLGRVSADDSSGDDFVLAKCLAEGGFSERAIRDVLGRRPSGAKWHRRGEEYRNRTVRRAIEAAVEDEYVSFERR